MGEHTWTGDEVGKLFNTLGRIEQKGDGHTDQIDTLFRKMDDMQKNGCAVGTANTQRISLLEEALKHDDDGPKPRSRKDSVVTISLTSAGVAAVGGAIVFIVTKLMG